MGNRDYGNDRGRRDEVFIRESGPGRVPGQRWSGGYGGDRDRGSAGAAAPADRYALGRGFTGSDFGAPAQRYFGNAVDRGGRMAPDGAETTGRGSSFGVGALEDERGPHWGKGPKGYKRNDERTREDVCDAIAYQGQIDATDVEVKVESGVVTLSGTVALRDHKRALERLVERCRGVHEVRNELRLAREVSNDGHKNARA